MSHDIHANVTRPSHEYFANELQIFTLIYRASSRSHNVKEHGGSAGRIHRLVDDVSRLDEDQANTVTVAACLLAATAVKQAKNRRLRNDRRKKSVWVRQWLLSRDKYGMYEKLIKHLKQGNVKSFRNFVRMDPGMFSEMVKDLKPLIQKKKTNWRKPLSAGLNCCSSLRIRVPVFE